MNSAKLGMHLLLAASLVMIVLNLIDSFIGIGEYPLFGVYGSIGVIIWAIMKMSDNMKKPGIMIKPGETFEAFQILTGIFSCAQGFIKFIEPHIGIRTLGIINAAPKGLRIQVLTTPFTKGDDSREILIQAQELMKERPELKIRSDVSKKDNKVAIHDPYILTPSDSWKLGSSTNFIGNKQTSIDPISVAEAEEMIEFFDKEWARSYEFV